MNRYSQRSFAGGELAPALYGRADTAKYLTGLRTARNFLIQRHGGAANRPGGRFVGEIKDSTNPVRLVPFIFSNDQTYLLEFGVGTIRFIKNGGYITEATKAITGITQASPAVVTSATHGYSNGDQVYVQGVVGMTEVNLRTFKVAGVTTNTFQLEHLDATSVDSTGFGAYSSGGTAARIYTISGSGLTTSSMPSLQWAQQGDFLSYAAASGGVSVLQRSGDTSWAIASETDTSGVVVPSSFTSITGVASWGGTSDPAAWAVTNYNPATLCESGINHISLEFEQPTAGTPGTVKWDDGSNRTGQVFKVYRTVKGILALVGQSSVQDGSGHYYFQDTGFTPDFTQQPPTNITPLISDPSVVSYYQQRKITAGGPTNPQVFNASQTGVYTYFKRTIPNTDSSPIAASILGRQVQQIRHILDLGKLLVFTASGEYSVEGDGTGILKPSAVNPVQHSAHGTGYLPPILVDSAALYVQARGNIIRDIAFDFEVDGYRGNDLTIMSSHLFEGFTIVDWTFQQTPNSLIWIVRSDGVLLSCTYIREQQMLAWTRHDFSGGIVESVCSIPEGNEDAVYIVVKRTIGGVTKRYVERLNTRLITDIRDAVFVDCSLAFDGRNVAATTMTITGGTGAWDYTQNMTLTSSAGFFTSDMVGNQMQIIGADGSLIRFTIGAYVSATVVTGSPNKNVPASLQGTATVSWARAVKTVTGLWHLEGQQVSVLADGYVVANPNNPNLQDQIITVANGQIILDKPYAVIQVGLPITSDIETLDLRIAQGEGLESEMVLVSGVTVRTEATRGLWAGAKTPMSDQDFSNLTEMKVREWENYGAPVSLLTDEKDLNIKSGWSNNGRAFIRQTDPLPITLLELTRTGNIPVGGAL